MGATLRDGPGWRAAGYLFVQLPLAVIGCYAVVIWWAAGLANMTYPLWWAGFRNHPPGVHLSPVPVLKQPLSGRAASRPRCGRDTPGFVRVM